MDGPNPVVVTWNILRSLISTSRPNPAGMEKVGHSQFGEVLAGLGDGGLPAAIGRSETLDVYLAELGEIDPDNLSRDEALAYWLNLYNAAAVQVAIEAWAKGEGSVLGIPGAFRRHITDVAGESLSLHDIEHGKIRRFGDPRIHGALVCGALSCPTLRVTPYSGDAIDAELDDQMRQFLANGGAVKGDDGQVTLSRVFLWYGSDFARPQRMPTLIPATKRATLESVRRWLPDDLKNATSVGFQSYDWGLACSIG